MVSSLGFTRKQVSRNSRQKMLNRARHPSLPDLHAIATYLKTGKKTGTTSPNSSPGFASERAMRIGIKAGAQTSRRKNQPATDADCSANLRSYEERKWSGQQDSNLRPSGPKPDALPGCAIPRAVDGLRFIRVRDVRQERSKCVSFAFCGNRLHRAKRTAIVNCNQSGLPIQHAWMGSKSGHRP